MLRAILVLFFLALYSDIGFSLGKLTIRPSYVLEDQRPKYSLGLTVYEKLGGNLYYSGWYGYGEHDALLGKEWFKMRQGVDYLNGPFSVEAGTSVQINPKDDFKETEIYSSITYTLW